MLVLWPLYFLIVDVTPRDRLRLIASIKEGKPCVVVATQCIEAGVDIDMGIWSFAISAPLDSLIQVAGRCNRHFARKRETVEVVNLVNDRNISFAGMIYDPVLLQAAKYSDMPRR